jgi:hypothetical protein
LRSLYVSAFGQSETDLMWTLSAEGGVVDYAAATRLSFHE